jgi:hypothetical protein
MWQTAGKAPVKPCALFCCVGGITINGTKTRCKRLYRAVLQQDKNKSPAPSADARQKKNPAISDRVKSFISAIQLNALCASILLTYNPR